MVLLVWILLLRQQTAIVLPKKVTIIELESSTRRRVVQTETVEKSDKAPKNAFLGPQNQKVDQETVSRNKTTVMSTPAKGSSKSKPHDLSKLGAQILPKTFSLVDQPEWATPGTRPQDYVNGLLESDRTALNTQEYVFYGYFQRIRERLDQAWVPILRERLLIYYRAGRQLASDMDHTTRVIVTLNEKGEVVRVQLLSPSGIRDLDDAAIAAFNKAGPFPNPPRGMIDINHEVRVPWDFVLKT